MATFITYRGLLVVSPEPLANGGLGLNTNFRSIADDLESLEATIADKQDRVIG